MYVNAIYFTKQKSDSELSNAIPYLKCALISLSNKSEINQIYRDGSIKKLTDYGDIFRHFERSETFSKINTDK